MKDKFKAMVERAIERGVSLQDIASVRCDNIFYDSVVEVSNFYFYIDNNYNCKIYWKSTIEVPKCIENNWSEELDSSQRNVSISLSDLLFNREFMRALFGEKGCKDYDAKGCEIWCNTKDKAPVCFGAGCAYGDDGTSRYIQGHLQRIVEVSMLPTDEQRIDYVHGLIKGESDE